MSLYDRFELLNLDRDDGVKTFEAREISTGRPVKVHLFVHPGVPLQAALLKEIDRLPADALQRIVDRGKHEGTPYVVTDRLADYPGLTEWLQAAGRQSKDNPPALGTAGAWKLPQTSPASASPPSLNKQFAELFATAERPVLPDTVIIPPQKPPVARQPPTVAPVPAAPAKPAPEAGEFTRMFQAPVTASQPAAPPAAPAAKEPGEFTRMFQAPVTGTAAPAPASKDFENFFEPASPAGPLPQSPAVQQPLTPQAPGGSGPNRVGEFTQMFGKIDGTKPAAPPSAPASKDPGEFTRMFQTPVAPAKPSASAPVPSSQPAPAVPLPAVPLPAAPPAPPQFAKPSGPGEYTRQFSAPAQLTFGQTAGQPPAPNASAPPAAFGTLPAMAAPSVPAPPTMPAAPAMPSAPPAAAPPKNSNLPLLLGIGVIVLLAVIIVIFFALRPK